MITLRSNRILILALALVLLSTFYLFYPSDHFLRPHSPLDPYNTYVSGGIDSDHWQDPIVPDLNDELGTPNDVCRGPGCEEDTRHHNPPSQAEKGSIRRPPKGAQQIAHKPLDEVIDEERMEDEQARGTADLPSGGKTFSGKNVNAGLVLEDNVLGGGVIMPKLENATAKAELGRAAWRVLHLMTLRYPENPTSDDRTALKSYFHLFSRLYPCGECAEEFQKLLKEYPPQTSSRKTASMWLCSVHNIINERLGKPEFDCLTLNDVYDCGCGPEGDDKAGTTEKQGDDKSIVDEKPAVKANKPFGGMLGKEKSRDDESIEEESRHDSGQYSAGGGVNAAADVKAWSVKEAIKQEVAIANQEGEEEAIYHPPKKAIKDKPAKVVPPSTEEDLLSTSDATAGTEAVQGVENEDESPLSVEGDELVEKEVVGLDEEADEDDSGGLGVAEHDGSRDKSI